MPRNDQAPVPRNPAAPSLVARAWYASLRFATLLILAIWGGIRVTGREHIPRTGGGLIASNHQSHLDVLALGVGVPRRLSFLARSTLFKPVLGSFFRSVGAFPIEREGVGVSGMKETIRRLRRGDLVLIFPEGTRSRDGQLGPLRPGVAALARVGVPLIPVAVAGTFEAMRRGQAWPRPRPIHVHFGAPIPPETLAGLAPDQLVALLRDHLLDCQERARCHLDRLETTGSGPGGPAQPESPVPPIAKARSADSG